MKIKLIGAANVPGKFSNQSEIYATISVDSSVKSVTRSRSDRWDETFDIPIDGGIDLEVAIFAKNSGAMLALNWFRISDLDDDTIFRFPVRPGSLNDMREIWLDLEPAGQLCVRALFGKQYYNEVQNSARARVCVCVCVCLLTYPFFRQSPMVSPE
jgi:hypothetical protein